VKKHLTTILLVLILVAGLSLLLYPSFSNWWNSFHSSKAISDYSEQVAKLDTEQYEQIWDAAIAYNQARREQSNVFDVTDEQRKAYAQMLNVGNNGVMGYIEIPSINVSLPIYHGTEESVLQVAVGHLEWSSLPTGGEGTHCVMSGHRGLPSARLFTDLDDLRTGDQFMIRVLDELMTYEVDQILIVDPNDVDDLLIEEGKDLVTLVTCTPYGINSHRLLVRGHRIENVPETVLVRVTANAMLVDPLITAVIAAVPMMVIAITILLAGGRRKSRSKKITELKQSFRKTTKEQ
jgi:sortase A